MRKRVVISAVNFTEGGPLTVLRDCLRAAAATLPEDWVIEALVHDAKLVNVPRVQLKEFPEAKKSWFKRLHLEWSGFRHAFRSEPVDLWLSLHDVTPRVDATRQAVYCHNPAPFYDLPLCEAFRDPKLWLFNRFYGQLYGAFIRHNTWVIVQQQWLRDAFKQRYGALPVVVANPDVVAIPTRTATPTKLKSSVYIFLYPTLPRVFKNVETVLDAMLLLAADGLTGVELRVTLKGDENAYARRLYERYHDTPGVRFIGRQTAEEMVEQYAGASAVLFPSKLETWGLPVSEAKAWGKPLLVADLSYAYETVGDYDQVGFLSATEPEIWAQEMTAMVRGEWRPDGGKAPSVDAPYVNNWPDLWALLIKDL
ncbi:glycosyltransferase [Sulfitobacter sp. 1A16787]|uniref:glycosyltransferase n=1 Tax=Sulfitobacter sp. 1A16787 TaxID=3368571 RepID=UPI00374614C3